MALRHQFSPLRFGQIHPNRILGRHEFASKTVPCLRPRNSWLHSLATVMGVNLESVTHSPERTDYLDGWRGIAIALVLEAHFFSFLPLEAGRMGVDVFFSLSGFLMSGVLFIQRQPLRKFYKRRISRIVPAFAIFVVSIYAFAYVRGMAFTGTEFVATLLFLRTYFPVDPGIWASAIPIGHLWSLNIEEHCYIFMSGLILVQVLRGREGVALFATGLACIAIGFFYVKLGSSAPKWGDLGTEVAASHLLISAGYRLYSDRVSPSIPPWLPILTLIAAFVCYSSLVPWWSTRLFSPFLLAFTVNHLSESSKWLRSLLGAPVLKFLGIWSFSIYLWQQPFFAFKAAIPGGSTMALVCAMTIGVFSFYVLEQPCRAWLNRIW